MSRIYAVEHSPTEQDNHCTLSIAHAPPSPLWHSPALPYLRLMSPEASPVLPLPPLAVGTFLLPSG